MQRAHTLKIRELCAIMMSQSIGCLGQRMIYTPQNSLHQRSDRMRGFVELRTPAIHVIMASQFGPSAT